MKATERQKASFRKYYLENREWLIAKAKKYRQEHKDEQRKYNQNHKLEHSRRALNYDKRVRRQVLDLLENKCVHCGITDIRVLQIDHVDSNGYQDIKKWGHGHPYYNHILKVNGVGYQLLCANCNWIKRYERKEHN